MTAGTITIKFMKINGSFVTLKVTYFEIAFASHPSSNISQNLIQYLSCVHTVHTSRVDHKEDHENQELRCACARSHTLRRITSPMCIVCGRMSGTRRVESPFTIFSGDPWGFPSVARALPPTHLGWPLRNPRARWSTPLSRACRRREG